MSVATSSIKLQRLALRLRKQFVDWTGRSGQTYFHHRVGEYRAMWRSAGEAVGGTFTELGRDVWQVERSGVVTRLLNHQMEFDNPVVLGLAGRKTIVHRLLADAGLSVPEHASFTIDDLGPASVFLTAHPGGCVVKPADGYGGQGVTTHVQSQAELRKAALLASLYGHELLIERQIPGESYRLLVVEGRVVHAVCRRGPRLHGDGSTTVRGLLDAENALRRQQGRPVLDVDRDVTFTLDWQGLSLDAAPSGAFLVKSVNDPDRKYVEVRTVYTDVVTDLVCPSIRADAEHAARLVGSDFLGVDIIMTDPSRPLAQTGGVLNEVNTTPALHHHYEAPGEPHPRMAELALDAVLRRKATRVEACR